jgi:hypothetical protein
MGPLSAWKYVLFPLIHSNYNHLTRYIPEEDYIGVLLGKADLENVYKELEDLTSEYALMNAATTGVAVGEGEFSSYVHVLGSGLNLYCSASHGGCCSKAGGFYLQR